MRLIAVIYFFLFSTLLLAKEETNEKAHTINFTEISAVEFVRFVSKIAEKTYIFNVEDLSFNLSFVSGKPVSSKELTKALVDLLEQRSFRLKEFENYILIEKLSEDEIKRNQELSKEKPSIGPFSSNFSLAKQGFHVYKLQYHKGSEILQTIKQLTALDHDNSNGFQNAVQSMQCIESTNSLVFKGSEETALEVQKLIKSLDVAQKQVFIEVLVIETDAKEASEFGLEWGGSGVYKEKLGVGFGHFPAHGGSQLAQSLKNTNQLSFPTGANQLPIGRGFDLGVIGDLIFHKGRTFLTLGSLISALEKDGKVSVVLNQKILTQDNKSSSIFVGDNIPFTGSVIQTIGASQQTTANIEYKDIGVSLNITPLLGDSDVITLDIKEEITEAREDLRDLDTRVNGIQTTKTNMATRVHVPDNHFLVLSGMVKNSKTSRKTGIPCLGGLPWIGALFSKTRSDHEKRNILVFVRPQIIHSLDEYQNLSIKEEQKFKKQTQLTDFYEDTK